MKTKIIILVALSFVLGLMFFTKLAREAKIAGLVEEKHCSLIVVDCPNE